MTAARRILSVLAAPCALLTFAALAGCTAVADSGSGTTTVGTVSGVGELPPTISATDTAAPDTAADTTGPGTDPSTTSMIPVAEPVGARAAGNRLLVIGDSLTASISKRYGDEACQALVPLGWRVEVDAETGRFIDFGKRVLDARLDAGWDAAVIFLGNNYGKDKAVYQGYLHAILLRLVPRPTVLITTGLFRPEQAEVNQAIMEEAAQFTSVTVLDWATLGTDPSLTGADNLHLTDAGRRSLAFYLAAALGTAPAQPGECLKTKFTDDSAGSPNGPPGNTTTTKTTVKPTATTVKTSGPTATTTVTSSSTANTTVNTTATTSPTTATTSPTTQTTAKPAPTTTAAPVVTLPPVTTPPPTTQPPPPPATDPPPKA